jgi:serine/threonine-protein kinase
MPDHDALKQALADHYRIDRELGRGGFATVFLAQGSSSRSAGGPEVLHPDVAASLGSERFRQEIASRPGCSIRTS